MERALSRLQDEDWSLRHDPQTFAVLYEATFDKVYTVIRYQVADDATADDITAQVYQRAMEHLSRFDPDRGTFINWLLGIARNVIREWRRGRAGLPLADTLRDPAPAPEDVVARREQADRLLTAVGRLSDREREIIGLRFGAGMTNRDIARIMDLSESNVGTILYRALGRVRDELEVDGD